jgi:hypothetical protein
MIKASQQDGILWVVQGLVIYNYLHPFIFQIQVDVDGMDTLGTQVFRQDTLNSGFVILKNIFTFDS